MVSTLRPRISRLAAVLAALAAVTGLAVSSAPALAGQWDYLLPAPGACGPAESSANAAAADHMAAAVRLVNGARSTHGVARLGVAPTGLGALQIAAYFKASDIRRCQSADPHTACGRPVDYWLNRYSGWRVYCTNGWWAETIYTASNTACEAVRGVAELPLIAPACLRHSRLRFELALA